MLIKGNMIRPNFRHLLLVWSLIFNFSCGREASIDSEHNDVMSCVEKLDESNIVQDFAGLSVSCFKRDERTTYLMVENELEESVCLKRFEANSFEKTFRDICVMSDSIMLTDSMKAKAFSLLKGLQKSECHSLYSTPYYVQINTTLEGLCFNDAIQLDSSFGGGVKVAKSVKDSASTPLAPTRLVLFYLLDSNYLFSLESEYGLKKVRDNVYYSRVPLNGSLRPCWW